MINAFQSHVNRVLVVLVVLTLVSFFVIDNVGHDPNNAWTAWASYLVIGLATFKARLIILDFMEVREAPLKWRRMYETWYVAICLLLIIGEFASVTAAS